MQVKWLHKAVKPTRIRSRESLGQKEKGQIHPLNVEPAHF